MLLAAIGSLVWRVVGRVVVRVEAAFEEEVALVVGREVVDERIALLLLLLLVERIGVEEEEEEVVTAAAASTPLTVVCTPLRQLEAPGSGVVTVLVKLNAFPSPFSKNPKTSNSVPSPSCKVKS